MQPKQMRETRSPVLPKLMYSMGPPRDIVAAPKRVVQGHHRGWCRHWGKPGTFWRGSVGKGSEELFGSEPNYSAVLSPSPEMNQVEISIRTIAQTRDRNTSFQFQFNP